MSANRTTSQIFVRGRSGRPTSTLDAADAGPRLRAARALHVRGATGTGAWPVRRGRACGPWEIKTKNSNIRQYFVRSYTTTSDIAHDYNAAPRGPPAGGGRLGAITRTMRESSPRATEVCLRESAAHLKKISQRSRGRSAPPPRPQGAPLTPSRARRALQIELNSRAAVQPGALTSSPVAGTASGLHCPRPSRARCRHPPTRGHRSRALCTDRTSRSAPLAE